MRLMTHKYKEAFRLIDSCVCDGVLTPQERQIYDVVTSIPDDLLIDARACRLKLYFVTYGCSDSMPFTANIEEDMLHYIANVKLVSAYCRLSVE